MDWATFISGGTALAVLAYAIKLTWQGSRVEKDIRSDAAKGDADLRESMNTQLEKLRHDLGEVEAKHNHRIEKLRQETGEVGSAIRQKIHEVEVFSRDHFVSKDSFEAVIDRFERTVENMTNRLEAKFEKAVDLFHKRPD